MFEELERIAENCNPVWISFKRLNPVQMNFELVTVERFLSKCEKNFYKYQRIRKIKKKFIRPGIVLTEVYNRS